MPEPMRVLLVFNAFSGAGRTGLDAVSIAERLLKVSSSAGRRMELEVVRTSCKGDCLDAARDSARSGKDILAAAGGDGTVMEAAAGIAFSGTALAILPTGSGNDTVFSISGHRELDRCLKDIAKGTVRVLDMGSMNGSPFLNVVGLGLDAEVNHEVARRRQMVKRYGPLATYTMAALKVLAGFKPYLMELSFEGGPPTVHEAGLCTVGNGTTCGGGFKLTPLALMDDGLLDVSVSGHIGRVRSVVNIGTVMRGRHIRKRETTYRQTKEVRIKGLDRELPYHVDGEGGFARELVLSVLPACLRTVHGRSQE